MLREFRIYIWVPTSRLFPPPPPCTLRPPSSSHGFTRKMIRFDQPASLHSFGALAVARLWCCGEVVGRRLPAAFNCDRSIVVCGRSLPSYSAFCRSLGGLAGCAKKVYKGFHIFLVRCVRCVLFPGLSFWFYCPRRIELIWQGCQTARGGALVTVWAFVIMSGNWSYDFWFFVFFGGGRAGGQRRAMVPHRSPSSMLTSSRHETTPSLLLP